MGDLTVNMEKLINGLIEARGLTLAELTAQLGYHSKTSLVRVMKNQANQRALDTFAKRLTENMRLSEAEHQRLERVLEYMRWQEDYVSSREMLKFLRGENDADGDVWLEPIAAEGRSLFAQRYEDASEIRIIMLNCQYVPIYRQLLRLVRAKGAEIEHYLQMRDNSARVIHAINVLIPLIYESGYSGYSHSDSEEDVFRGVQGVRAADAMVVRYRTADGCLLEDLIVFDQEDHGFVQTAAQSGGFVRMLGLRPEEYTPIKNVYFQNPALESYIRFCTDYARLEHNRTIYKIKPDVGLEWIPEDVLISALVEGGIPELKERNDLCEAFREVHHERVHNMFGKRRVARTIMKRSAMVRFARTGRTMDHFWGMRSFTQEERIRIFRLLLEQMESNPYFNVYFLKDNDFLQDAEIAYYEGAGIMVMDASTDYAPSGKHSEVMIVHDDFMRMFREYFERSLLTEHTMSHGETVAFMQELIRIAASEA